MSADEIIKYKQLLDEGVITQEEFDRKKQELLDAPVQAAQQIIVEPKKEENLLAGAVMGILMLIILGMWFNNWLGNYLHSLGPK